MGALKDLLLYIDDFTHEFIQSGLFLDEDMAKEDCAVEGTSWEDFDWSETSIDAESLKQISEECEDFVTQNWDKLRNLPGYATQSGYDFWLTRNRHGAGFWDRGYGKVGDELTNAAHTYGECHFMACDDQSIQYV